MNTGRIFGDGACHCVLQAMTMSEDLTPLNPLDLGLGYTRMLPDLSNLVQLTALNLSENMLQSVPTSISKLTNLRALDLSCNEDLTVSLSKILQISNIS